MYHAFGLLLPDSDFNIAEAGQKLATVFPALQQERTDRSLTLSDDSWEIHLTLEEGQQVLEESAQIADHIGGDLDELGIRTCNRRVDVASDVPDPEMDHFNDYLQVIEVLQSFRGVIPIDPSEPALL